MRFYERVREVEAYPFYVQEDGVDAVAGMEKWLHQFAPSAYFRNSGGSWFVTVMNSHMPDTFTINRFDMMVIEHGRFRVMSRSAFDRGFSKDHPGLAAQKAAEEYSA